MAVRSTTKSLLKASEPSAGADDRADDAEEQRPRNLPPNTFPTEGFSIEVDGKIKSQHATAEAATQAGAELKRRFPVLKVMVYDAAVKTRTLVEADK